MIDIFLLSGNKCSYFTAFIIRNTAQRKLIKYRWHVFILFTNNEFRIYFEYFCLTVYIDCDSLSQTYIVYVVKSFRLFLWHQKKISFLFIFLIWYHVKYNPYR